MKLLQLIEASAGGAGRHAVDLTEMLLARGHEVHLVYSDLRADQVFCQDRMRLHDYPHYREYRLPMRRAPHWSDPGVARALRRYLRTAGPFDLVHCHSTKAGVVGRLGLSRARVPRVYTPHGFFTMDQTRGALLRTFAGWMEAALALACDGVVVTSPEESEHARGLGILARKLSLIPNGTLVERVHLAAMHGENIRSDWGFDQRDVSIGFVGRLVPVKAPQTLLRAVAAMPGDALARVRLVIVGDGPLRATLKRLSRDLGIEERVLWLGERNAPALMHAFDVLAITSESEGTPLVLLEALARGIPVVATRVGMVPERIQPGVNGFIAPVGDIGEIARCLSTLVRDPALRERMGISARNQARQFAIDPMVDHTLDLYARLVNGARNTNMASSRAAASTTSGT